MNGTISLALIVRDSSATLDKCLSTFKEVADEIVVVDTGSVDNTVEIAKKYTDKVYFFKWIDDFSAARNFSFSKCTRDYILWVDSDDYILPEDIQKVKDLDLSDKEIVICNYEYAHDEFNKSISTVPRERIVKRSLGLLWEGLIHEVLPLLGRTHITDISTHHNKQHGSSERNHKMLEEIVKINPSPRNIYYLGKENFEMGLVEPAIKYLQMFVDKKEGFWEDQYQAYYKLAQIYMGKGDDAAFKENIYKSLAIEERWAEPYNLLGLFYMNKNQWDKSIFWYEAALNVKRPKELLAYYQPEQYTWLPALNLVVAYNNIGNIKKAYEYNKKVLEYRPQDSRALNNDKILREALARDGEKAREVAASPGRKDGQGKRLNLGCGNKPMPGYTNVDVFQGPIVNEVFPFDEIPYTDGSIGAIHSEHALEHVPFRRVEKALKEWSRVLKPGGELLLKIPDFGECCRSYVEAKTKYDRWWYKATIYGIQESQAGEPDECQVHKSGFSQDEIGEVLERFDFVVGYVKPYDGFRTPSLEILAHRASLPKKVGWIAPENWEAAQTRIRVLQVNKWLEEQSYQSKVVGTYNDIIEYGFDIAIVGKSFSQADIDGIKMLKEKGKRVIADLCEDLLDGTFPYVREVIAECDSVVCCSPKLAEICSSINKNVCVIEDAWE